MAFLTDQSWRAIKLRRCFTDGLNQNFKISVPRRRLVSVAFGELFELPGEDSYLKQTGMLEGKLESLNHLRNQSRRAIGLINPARRSIL